MITADTPVFPNNAVALISARFEMEYPAPDLPVVHQRPLRTTDDVQAIGIFAAAWAPDEDSFEFRGDNYASVGPEEPTLQRYTLTIQGLIQDTDEERGLAVHSVLAKTIRSMLYRDNALRVGLASLSSEMNGSTEWIKRWGMTRTRYLSNEIQGTWIYLSTLDFWLETETS